VPVLDAQLHGNRGEMVHLSVHTGRTAAVQQQLNSGHVFQEIRTTFNVVTVHTVRLSVHRIRGGRFGFLPVNFKHGNRGKR
jgi:hypothetical protein